MVLSTHYIEEELSPRLVNAVPPNARSSTARAQKFTKHKAETFLQRLVLSFHESCVAWCVGGKDGPTVCPPFPPTCTPQERHQCHDEITKLTQILGIVKRLGKENEKGLHALMPERLGGGGKGSFRPLDFAITPRPPEEDGGGYFCRTEEIVKQIEEYRLSPKNQWEVGYLRDKSSHLKYQLIRNHLGMVGDSNKAAKLRVWRRMMLAAMPFTQNAPLRQLIRMEVVKSEVGISVAEKNLSEWGFRREIIIHERVEAAKRLWAILQDCFRFGAAQYQPTPTPQRPNARIRSGASLNIVPKAPVNKDTTRYTAPRKGRRPPSKMPAHLSTQPPSALESDLASTLEEDGEGEGVGVDGLPDDSTKADTIVSTNTEGQESIISQATPTQQGSEEALDLTGRILAQRMSTENIQARLTSSGSLFLTPRRSPRSPSSSTRIPSPTSFVSTLKRKGSAGRPPSGNRVRITTPGQHPTFTDSSSVPSTSSTQHNHGSSSHLHPSTPVDAASSQAAVPVPPQPPPGDSEPSVRVILRSLAETSNMDELKVPKTRLLRETGSSMGRKIDPRIALMNRGTLFALPVQMLVKPPD